MTLIQSIKKFLALCDEYAPDSGLTNLYTSDEDIQTKAKLLYGPVYQELANIWTTSKVKELSFTYTGEEAYEEVKLPDARTIKKIFCLDENNVPTTGEYFYISDTKVMLSKEKDIKFMCEYIPNITPINEETDNEFELELPQAIQEVLAIKVASNLFITDPSVNYQAFEAKYQTYLNNLSPSSKGISVEIMEGEL